MTHDDMPTSLPIAEEDHGRGLHGSSTYFHQCPDLGALPASVDVDTFDQIATETDALLVLADIYAARRASHDLLARSLPDAWQSKQFGQWIDIALTRQMFREIGFTFDGQPRERPRHSLTLFRGAPSRTRHGVSWTTSPEAAAGIGAYYDGSAARVWTVRVPPERLLGFVSFEDEFLVDLEGYEERIQPVIPEAVAHRRTLKRVDRWIRTAHPEFYAARQRWL